MAEERRKKVSLSLQSILILLGYIVSIVSAFIYLQAKVWAIETSDCEQEKRLCAIEEKCADIKVMNYKLDLLLGHFKLIVKDKK